MRSYIIGCALKGNTILRELYLGENNLQPADGAHIYQIIIASVSIQLLDLRNNQLQVCTCLYVLNVYILFQVLYES